MIPQHRNVIENFHGVPNSSGMATGVSNFLLYYVVLKLIHSNHARMLLIQAPRMENSIGEEEEVSTKYVVVGKEHG